jgi:hypothetical protein
MAISFLEDLLAEVSHEAAFMSLALLFYSAVLFLALFLCSGAGSGVIHCLVYFSVFVVSMPVGRDRSHAPFL